MVVAHLVLALLQTAVILGAGVFILDGDVLGNVFFLAMVVVLGNLVFLSIGFIVGSIAKNVGRRQRPWERGGHADDVPLGGLLSHRQPSPSP